MLKVAISRKITVPFYSVCMSLGCMLLCILHEDNIISINLLVSIEIIVSYYMVWRVACTDDIK